MGTLTVTEFLTLDGVAQAPGGREEDLDGGFEHGGWQMPLLERESSAVIFEQASTMDALLLGRRTYEIFAAYWPNAPQEFSFTGLMNRVPKFVASRTLADPLTWSGSTVLQGEVADSVARLKEQHQDVQVIGSLDLVQSLLRHGLVDRLHLWFYPLLLGSGKRLFGAGVVPAQLRLVASRTYPDGVLQIAYEL